MNQPVRQCSNCKRPLRALTLAGHYHRVVEVDTCDRCCLVWFDETESVRLAGPGVADLVRVIHAAMQGGDIHPHAASLARVQACPVCDAELKPVANASRYGRTAQLQCPRGHGYYQTYMLYLAEKGFVRPLAWADIRQLTASGKELFCAACGASMPARPHDACPYCHSAVGILDPARLASAIDPDAVARLSTESAHEPPPADAAARAPAHHPPAPADAANTGSAAGASAAPGHPTAPTAIPAGCAPAAGLASGGDAALPQRDLHHCHACGNPVDATRDLRCPACHAPVLRADTGSALAAAEAVDTAVRSHYARQAPAVSRAKLRAASAHAAASAGIDMPPRWRSLKARHVASLIVFACVLAVWQGNRPAPAPNRELTDEERAARMGPEAPLLTFAGTFKPPPIACAPDAAARNEVVLRALTFTPSFDMSPQPVASLGALRAAHIRALRARNEWRTGIPYETLLQRYAGPVELEYGPPSGFMARSALAPQVAAAAFCLPLNEIGPPVLAADGFHVIQVVDAR
jgi:hypothetical protein